MIADAFWVWFLQIKEKTKNQSTNQGTNQQRKSFDLIKIDKWIYIYMFLFKIKYTNISI